MRRAPILAILAALAGGFSAGAASTQVSDAPSPALQLARQLNEAFVEVAEKVSPSVAVLETLHQTPRGPRLARGSGVIISEEGYILTNNHIVEGAESINVRLLDGRRFPAEIRGLDPQSDLAVIKIDGTGLPSATLGDSASTRVGEFVVAIGAPLNLNYSVTVGHVSGKGRAFGRPSTFADHDFIQTDARINPGNSGGPLVNLYGEVIGINSMVQVEFTSGGMASGIGFAVPSNLAKIISARLIQDGKFVRSMIGVTLGDLQENPRFRERNPGILEGVIVSSILRDGPASRSILRPSDVVVAVDGEPVNTVREMQEAIFYRPPGTAIVLDVLRNQARLQARIVTQPMPDQLEVAATRPLRTQEETIASHGLTVRALTLELAQEKELPVSDGVLVVAVTPEGPAALGGIRAGDIVTDVNGEKVLSVRELRQTLRRADPGPGIVINLVTEGASRFVILRTGE